MQYRTAAIINKSFAGVETFTLVKKPISQTFTTDWWLYGGTRIPMQSVEQCRHWGTAISHEFDGVYFCNCWNDWSKISNC